jgi:hypothetical protein
MVGLSDELAYCAVLLEQTHEQGHRSDHDHRELDDVAASHPFKD